MYATKNEEEEIKDKLWIELEETSETVDPGVNLIVIGDMNEWVGETFNLLLGGMQKNLTADCRYETDGKTTFN